MRPWLCFSSDISRKSVTHSPLHAQKSHLTWRAILARSPSPPCSPFPELPGPPTNLGISNIGPRSVTLQFRPGYDGKTSISRWLVEAQVGQAWGLGSSPRQGTPVLLRVQKSYVCFSLCEFSHATLNGTLYPKCSHFPILSPAPPAPHLCTWKNTHITVPSWVWGCLEKYPGAGR